MKDEILSNLDNIIEELEKGNDILIKKVKAGLKIQSVKVKNIKAESNKN